MLMPASPTMVPTRPIMPGRSSLRTTSMWRAGAHNLAGTLVGMEGEARLVTVDDHRVDVPPARHMLVVRNDDRPGMIGRVGTIVGEAGINIADMDVGRSATGSASAMMVLATTDPVPAEVCEGLRAIDGIISVDTL